MYPANSFDCEKGFDFLTYDAPIPCNAREGYGQGTTHFTKGDHPTPNHPLHHVPLSNLYPMHDFHNYLSTTPRRNYPETTGSQLAGSKKRSPRFWMCMVCVGVMLLAVIIVIAVIVTRPTRTLQTFLPTSNSPSRDKSNQKKQMDLGNKGSGEENPNVLDPTKPLQPGKDVPEETLQKPTETPTIPSHTPTTSTPTTPIVIPELKYIPGALEEYALRVLRTINSMRVIHNANMVTRSDVAAMVGHVDEALASDVEPKDMEIVKKVRDAYTGMLNTISSASLTSESSDWNAFQKARMTCIEVCHDVIPFVGRDVQAFATVAKDRTITREDVGLMILKFGNAVSYMLNHKVYGTFDTTFETLTKFIMWVQPTFAQHNVISPLSTSAEDVRYGLLSISNLFGNSVSTADIRNIIDQARAGVEFLGCEDRFAPENPSPTSCYADPQPLPVPYLLNMLNYYVYLDSVIRKQSFDQSTFTSFAEKLDLKPVLSVVSLLNSNVATIESVLKRIKTISDLHSLWCKDPNGQKWILIDMFLNSSETPSANVWDSLAKYMQTQVVMIRSFMSILGTDDKKTDGLSTSDAFMLSMIRLGNALRNVLDNGSPLLSEISRRVDALHGEMEGSELNENQRAFLKNTKATVHKLSTEHQTRDADSLRTELLNLVNDIYLLEHYETNIS